MPDATMTTSKRQTRSLRNINGQLPVLRVIVGTCFRGSRITVRLWDPEEYDDGAPDIEIDRDLFLRLYYQRLVEYARILTVPPQQPQARRSIQIVGLDATLVVDEQIVSEANAESADCE
jgi:hypothetical protein